MGRREADVIVVGAGLAGLSAARALVASGHEVIVVEARDRVGGRIENGFLEGEPVELGGQWVGPGQDEVLGLIAELGLETFPTWTEGVNLFDSRGSISHYRGTIPKVNPFALAELAIALKRIDRLARGIDPARPWTAPKAGKWDSMSVADWVSRTVLTGQARDLIRLAVHAVWAAEPEEISMLHFLAYARSGGSIESLLDTEAGAQDSRIVGGSQAIANRMAEDLGDRVLTGLPVATVVRDDGAVRLVAAGESFEARRAIFTVPPALTDRIEWSPALPEARSELTASMLPGRAIKAMAAYEKPFWREEGLSGSVTSIGSPVSMVFDNTPPSGTPGVLVSFFEGSAADRAGAMDDPARRGLVTDNLARLFGEKASNPVDYVDRCWAKEEFSGGCSGAFMPPGAWTARGIALSEPVGPIHWAGAEVATRWTGYMDGAIRSGREAAAAVAASL